MSDPKPTKTEEKKVDAHAGDHHGGDTMSFESILKYMVLAVFFVAIVFVVMSLEATQVQNFLYFIYLIHFFVFSYIAYYAFKIKIFHDKFMKWNHEIGHIYEKLNGQDHGHHGDHASHGGGHDEHGHDNEHDDHHKNKEPENIFEERLQKARAHIKSNFSEEWKIGLIELDNLLKDLLIKNDFAGETIIDLLNDAKSKGMSNIEDGLLAHKAKVFLLKNNLDVVKANNIYLQTLAIYEKVLEELL